MGAGDFNRDDRELDHLSEILEKNSERYPDLPPGSYAVVTAQTRDKVIITKDMPLYRWNYYSNAAYELFVVPQPEGHFLSMIEEPGSLCVHVSIKDGTPTWVNSDELWASRSKLELSRRG